MSLMPDAKVLMSTLKLSHKEWLKTRRTFIGSSDAPKIALPNYKWGSKWTIFWDKTSTEEPTETESEAAEWGHRHEKEIARAFSDKTGWRVQRRNAILLNRQYPWMGADLDFLTHHPEYGVSILECKTASEYLKGEWEGENVPDAYYVQVQHQLAVTGLKHAFIAVLIGGNKFRWYHIERDEQMIQVLIDLENDFWNNYVVKGIAPAPDGSEAASELITGMFPEAKEEEVELPSDAEEWVSVYLQASAEVKAAESRKSEAQNRLKVLLGENKAGIVGDHRVTWSRFMKQKFDDKTFQNEHPELYEKYVITANSSQFRVK